MAPHHVWSRQAPTLKARAHIGLRVQWLLVLVAALVGSMCSGVGCPLSVLMMQQVADTVAGISIVRGHRWQGLAISLSLLVPAKPSHLVGPWLHVLTTGLFAFLRIVFFSPV
mmetsp:Transcript_7429/g.22972  ORF Transcript_7429/g.22972 Transcript_7429/m.22972 type:complete len:112 (+) Transcript_7429:1604-1939(+)